MRWREWVRSGGTIPETSGFRAAPPRPWWLVVALFAAVVVFATVVARVFRDTAEHVIEWYADREDAVDASRSLWWLVLFAVVTGTVLVAALIGRAVESRPWPGWGIEAVAASARGESQRISFRASASRALATWLASIGLSSIGRESAIVEMGGAFGTVAGRRSGGRGDALATAGIAAAFAAAYHAPLAAVAYLEEHLAIRRSPRALWFAATGAVAGHLLSTRLLDGHALLPAPESSRWEMLGLTLLVVVPATVAARAFRIARVRVKAAPLAERLGVPWWSTALAFAVVAGVAVVTFPAAAGNGIEALRRAADEPTLTIAWALCVGKLIGTTASLGSGAPGGALTPSMSIASGAALLTLVGAEHLGLGDATGSTWAVMVGAMAIGVTVGLRSPVLAIVLVPELVGDYTLVPVIAVVTGASVLVDRVVGRLVARVATPVPDVIYDEDA